MKLEIDRRDLVCGMAGSFALLSQSGWIASASDATIMHVIRIKLADDVDPAVRRQRRRCGIGRAAAEDRRRSRCAVPHQRPPPDLTTGARSRRGHDMGARPAHLSHAALQPRCHERGTAHQRFAAIRRCAQIKGVEQLVSGANVSRNPADRYTHAMMVVLQNPEAYGRFLKDPLFQAEIAAGGVLAPGNVEWFDIIDPAADGLGERLRRMHT